MQLYSQQTRETRPFPEEKQDKLESVKVLAKEVSSNLVLPFLLFAKNNRSLQRGLILLKLLWCIHHDYVLITTVLCNFMLLHACCPHVGEHV